MAFELPLPPTTFPVSEQRNASSASSQSKRRRFQVPITRYFNADDASSSAAPQTLSPSLPETIQSSLLMVGMRIRKSVPEGYKTMVQKELSFQSYSSPTSDAFGTSQNELAPYCGLHRIGGMAVQPIPTSTAAYTSAHSSITLSAADQEDPFSLPSSQESTYTVASDNGLNAMEQGRPGKRSFDDEDDEDEDDINSSKQQSLHRRGSSYPFSHTRMPDLNTMSPPSQPITREHLGLSGRIMAQPRSRRAPGQRPSTKRKPSWNMTDQENSSEWQMDLENAAFHNDFEEATFLQSREDVEMGM